MNKKRKNQHTYVHMNNFNYFSQIDEGEGKND